jgi:hypothetical protein
MTKTSPTTLPAGFQRRTFLAGSAAALAGVALSGGASAAPSSAAPSSAAPMLNDTLLFGFVDGDRVVPVSRLEPVAFPSEVARVALSEIDFGAHEPELERVSVSVVYQPSGRRFEAFRWQSGLAVCAPTAVSLAPDRVRLSVAVTYRNGATYQLEGAVDAGQLREGRFVAVLPDASGRAPRIPRRAAVSSPVVIVDVRAA